jgi:hypothetical protein
MLCNLVHFDINTLTYYLLPTVVFRGIMSSMKEDDMPRHSPYRIVLTPAERIELESIARRYTSAYYEVVRAKIVLLAAEGLDNDKIGRKLDLPRQIASKWRKRFFDERLDGLEDRPRRGRPAVFSPFGGRRDKGPGL